MSNLGFANLYYPISIRSYTTTTTPVLITAGPVTFRYTRGRHTVLHIVRRTAAGVVAYRLQLELTGGEENLSASRFVGHINNTARETFPAAETILVVTSTTNPNAHTVNTADAGRIYVLTFTAFPSILPTIQQTAGAATAGETIDIVVQQGYLQSI